MLFDTDSFKENKKLATAEEIKGRQLSGVRLYFTPTQM
jgi:hypothetical protein